MVRRTVCGFGEGFGADNDQVGFVAVEFENLMSARQLAVSGGGDGVGGDVKLDVISMWRMMVNGPVLV